MRFQHITQHRLIDEGVLKVQLTGNKICEKGRLLSLYE